MDDPVGRGQRGYNIGNKATGIGRDLRPVKNVHIVYDRITDMRLTQISMECNLDIGCATRRNPVRGGKRGGEQHKSGHPRQE